MAGEAPIPDHISREEALMLIKPETWKFFTQPGGMVANADAEGNVTGYQLNSKAENLKNLTPNYYPDIITGKTKSWIDVYVLNKLGSLNDGKPIYQMFDETVHVAREPILATPGVPILVGLDFGLTPAAAFVQHVRGRWMVLHELVAQDMGIIRFAEVLRTEMAQKFPGAQFVIYGDPAGDYRAQTDERTPFQILRQAGLKAYTAPTNDPALRIEAVATPLNRLVDGQPGFLIDQRCTHLIKGFRGGYQYRRLQVSGGARYEDKPDKNMFSHVHDALQYALCGGGEARALTVGRSDTRPVNARAMFDIFRRQPRMRERNL
jgi:hypothetical protein